MLEKSTENYIIQGWLGKAVPLLFPVTAGELCWQNILEATVISPATEHTHHSYWIRYFGWWLITRKGRQNSAEEQTSTTPNPVSAMDSEAGAAFALGSQLQTWLKLKFTRSPSARPWAQVGAAATLGRHQRWHCQQVLMLPPMQESKWQREQQMNVTLIRSPNQLK